METHPALKNLNPRLFYSQTARQESGLSDDDLDLLIIERNQFALRGTKEAVIRARFGISLNQYALRLCELAESPEAMKLDPILIKRVQRQINRRRTAWNRRTPA